jgi:hypothetical protein
MMTVTLATGLVDVLVEGISLVQPLQGKAAGAWKSVGWSFKLSMQRGAL